MGNLKHPFRVLHSEKNVSQGIFEYLRILVSEEVLPGSFF